MIIAFTGLARSGKTTSYDHLVKEHSFVKINFKDALVKEMREELKGTLEELSKLYGLPVDWLFENKPPVIRALMQNFGTEIKRKQNEDYWTLRWMQAAVKARGHGKSIVVDDCRFLNEAETVRLLGGKIYRIVRKDITDTGNHQSEKEMKKIEVDGEIISEPGDVPGLLKKVDELLNKNGT